MKMNLNRSGLRSTIRGEAHVWSRFPSGYSIRVRVDVRALTTTLQVGWLLYMILLNVRRTKRPYATAISEIEGRREFLLKTPRRTANERAGSSIDLFDSSVYHKAARCFVMFHSQRQYTLRMSSRYASKSNHKITIQMLLKTQSSLANSSSKYRFTWGQPKTTDSDIGFDSRGGTHTLLITQLPYEHMTTDMHANFDSRHAVRKSQHSH